MKCLVTGGAGFIGSHLVNKLIEKNLEVVVIDNLSTGKRENLNPKAIFHQLDICDFNSIEPVFKGVDFVFHLAAIPRVPLSIEDPIGTSKVNVMGTINVFKAAADNKVKRVIFSSSSSLYGDQKEFPLKETMAPNPKSPYGLQKLIGEQVAKIFLELYSLPVVSLRYFNVYGPGIDFNSDYSLVLGKFLKLRSQNKPLTIFGDGQQTRGFCYVEDVAEANIKAMESPNIKGGEIINIGQEKSYSINDLAQLMGGSIQYFPPRAGDVIHTQADISVARKLLGWEPKTNFAEGVESTKKWFEEIKSKSKNYRIGIMGLGMVGGALNKYFEKNGVETFKYDKGRNLGSIEEVNNADIIFVCVPTPFVEGSGLDFSYVEEACNNVKGSKIVVLKSTILPGTTERLQKKHPEHKLLFNPEFLVEENAEKDMENPDRQIVGYTDSSEDLAQTILALLPKAPFEKIVKSSEAEMIKYFGNTFLSMKVIFGNQMYDLCKKLGIDYNTVKECASQDKRILSSHLDVNHGGYRGYAGKCLPKDTKSLVYFADEKGMNLELLKAVEEINNRLAEEQGVDLQILKASQDIGTKNA